jgi:hypothetical protein
MRKRTDMSNPPARRRALLVLLTCLGLAVTSLAAGTLASTATAANPAPVLIRIDGISSATTAPVGTPGGAVPYVLVKAGDDFVVDVSFYDVSGAPASFNSDTTLNITSSAGALSPSTGIAPKGETSAHLTTSLGKAANQVSITVSVATKRNQQSGVTPGTSSASQLFDVLSDLRFEDSSPNQGFLKGIGGSSDCTEATKQAPVCGIAILPNGANSQVLLSLGVCDSAYAGCGSNKGAVVQALADLSGLYSNSSPATILVKCDKSLCPGGAIKNYHLSFSLNGNDALGNAPACPAKATIGDGQAACVDYVQSTRDGSGDTLLYLLIAQDVRISVG